MGNNGRLLLVGIYFGILLVKSEVMRWERIHNMFLLREAHMYLVIGSAIVVAGLAMALIRRFEVRDLSGAPIRYEAKPYHKGVLLGGALFGAGRAGTGACPRPLSAPVGAGAWAGVPPLSGAVGGGLAHAAAAPRAPPEA